MVTPQLSPNLTSNLQCQDRVGFIQNFLSELYMNLFNSPDRKKFKGQDSSKASSSFSQKSRHKDQDSDTEDNTYEAAEEEEIPAWLRCSPSDLYFNRDNAVCLLNHMII